MEAGMTCDLCGIPTDSALCDPCALVVGEEAEDERRADLRAGR
jgi:hypothetical protein